MIRQRRAGRESGPKGCALKPDCPRLPKDDAGKPLRPQPAAQCEQRNRKGYDGRARTHRRH